jgi:hypothetical protein
MSADSQSQLTRHTPISLYEGKAGLKASMGTSRFGEDQVVAEISQPSQGPPKA